MADPQIASDPACGHGGRLTIDLDAIFKNYQTLAGQAAPATCAVAVKADAYGLGLEPVARTLWAAGARTYYVAHLSEAERLAGILGDGATIYALNGLPPGTAERYQASGLRPVLCSLEDIAEWREFCAKETDSHHPQVGIMVDTGLNRLGLGLADLDVLTADLTHLAGINIAVVMSHLACADEPEHAMNEFQLANMSKIRDAFPDTPIGLSNSSGINMGAAYRFDLARTGIALYGGRARAKGPNPMAPVARLEAPVIQIRHVKAGETIGYGATYRFPAAAQVAILSIGYADGLFRCLSSSGQNASGAVYFGEFRAPIVGRISMDLTAVDVTAVPANLCGRGAWAEVIGPHQSADHLATDAKTIDYEVFTKLGSRYERVYTGLNYTGLNAIQG